ncbi:MAG: hypothetical protein EOO41_04705 [Methanobacteriota archaeon]|nr:MAG: hypothetical protein EOO41_04705 [Euryarchaeota archaeon]
MTDPFVKRSGKTSLLAGGLLASIVEVGAGEGPKAADAAEFGYAMTSLPATGASVVPGTSWVFPETSEAPAASLQLESFLEGIDGLGGETGAAASHT